MARINPLEPPYEPAVAAQLESMMPPGAPPIGLFRTFARNLPMAQAMGGWGRYELSKRLSLSMRQRELVIDRVTASSIAGMMLAAGRLWKLDWAARVQLSRTHHLRCHRTVLGPAPNP
jgi:hypothetical protein